MPTIRKEKKGEKEGGRKERGGKQGHQSQNTTTPYVLLATGGPRLDLKERIERGKRRGGGGKGRKKLTPSFIKHLSLEESNGNTGGRGGET